ncbi:helix-turn-helix transcriptional regulator [Polaromonas sp.]|uniref:helix-turn-helix transcriptional regulator n=1 Tax=Polaromonas sp. TaxID=1869339 RepID=UPI003751B9B6
MNTLLNAGFTDPAPLLADLELSESSADLFSTLIDVLAHGVIVVGERGQLVHANQAARAELNRRRVLEKVGDEVHALTPADGKTLHMALNKAVAGKRSLINVSSGGLSLMLAVVPLKPEIGAREIRIALLFSRAEVCESGMFGFFARSYGLTQTEEQVLIILCKGLSTPEIALQMKVAVSTVRSHVRSLCAKTGSSGVRELVNRVAVLPPVAPLHLVQIH